MAGVGTQSGPSAASWWSPGGVELVVKGRGSGLVNSVVFPEGLPESELEMFPLESADFSDIDAYLEQNLNAEEVKCSILEREEFDLASEKSWDLIEKVRRWADGRKWIGDFADEGLLAVRWDGTSANNPTLWSATGQRESLARMLADPRQIDGDLWGYEFRRQVVGMGLSGGFHGGMSIQDAINFFKTVLFMQDRGEQVGYAMAERMIDLGGPDLQSQVFESEQFESDSGASLIPRWAAVSLGQIGPLLDSSQALPIVQVLADPAAELPQEGEWAEDLEYLTNVTFLNLQSEIESDLLESWDGLQGELDEVSDQLDTAHEEGASQATLDRLSKKRDRLEKMVHQSTDSRLGGPGDFLFEPRSHPPEPSQLFVEVARRAGYEASKTVAMLLLDGPTLHCEIQPIADWADGPPLCWLAAPKQSPGLKIGLGSLSAAERRWCTVAIRLSTGPLSELILLDEPERGLHLRAQRHLAKGLKELSTERRCPVVVSSHSPEMLRDSENRLVHVTRDGEGNVRTHAMGAPTREDLDALGLEPVDVLQLTERFVIVEGEHDKIALDVFLGDHLADLRAVVLPMRGTTNLASTIDSQFLWEFTSAGVVIVLDNTRVELARQMLSDLDRALCDEDQEAISRLLEGWKPGKGKGLSAEEKKLGEFLQQLAYRAVLDGRLDRVNVFGFEKEDIVEYFDCATLVPGHSDWAKLREQHRSHSGTPWKKWLENDHNAIFEPVKVHEAARAVADSPPSEVFDLLEVVQSVPGRSTEAIELTT